MQTCEVCPNQGILRCTGCAESHYCSKQCQKRGWHDHKHLCKAFDAFRTPPSTDDENGGYIRAIYFPVGDEKPRFEWLPCSKIADDYVRVGLKDLLAATEEEQKSGRYEAPDWTHVNTVIGPDQYMPHTIRVQYRSNSQEPNKTIQKISDARSPYLHCWKGPVVAYGIKTFTADSHAKQAVDLATADMREIVNFFNTYLLGNPAGAISTPASSLLNAIAPSKMLQYVQCVRVNCDGDVSDNGRPRYETIDLPIKHGIFQQAPFHISSGIGLPLFAARIPGSVEMWDSKGANNAAAFFLLMSCNSGAASFGCVSATWGGPVGSFIVARSDKNSVMPDHVNSLVNYSETCLAPVFQKQRDGILTEDEVLEHITKVKFAEYYEAWEAEQLKT